MSRGKYESGEDTYQKWIADLIEAESDEDLAALYEAGEGESDDIDDDTLPVFDSDRYDEDSQP